MAQEEVGYVELEWTCPRCQTRNPGTQPICSGCGAPQPANVQFQTPAAAPLEQDQGKIAHAKGGPDIHCGFCGARNPADAKTCRQCGADLTQGTARPTGQIVGAFDAGAPQEVKCATCGTLNPSTAKMCSSCGAPLGRPAPQPTAAAQAPTSSQGSGWGKWILAGVGILVVVGLIWLLVSLFRTSSTVATAAEARWERRIEVLALVPVRSTAWRDQLPSGVTNVSCQSALRSTSSSPVAGARKVCGTPYTVDTGTGMGRVVKDCQYEVYDDRCSYTTTQWGVISTAADHGVGFSPAWPAVNLAGNQRLGARSETYTCILRDGKKEYSYTMNPQEYAKCQPGSRWKLDVNSFGEVMSAQLAP